MFGYIARFKRRFIASKIGNRLTLYSISIGMLLAVLFISVVSLYQYQAEKKRLFDTADALVVASERSLSSGLLVNRFQGVSIIEDGMDKLTFIKAFKIETEKGDHYQYRTAQDHYHVFERPIMLNDKRLGSVKLYIDDAYLFEQVVSKLKIIALASFLLFGLLSVLFAFLLNYMIVRHIKKMAALATSSSRLNATSYIPIRISRTRNSDEITALLDALNYSQRKYKALSIEKASYESMLSFQANYDALTNLPNRRHFNAYLENQLQALKDTSDSFSLAVLFVDLDGLKNINDGQGHDVGDHIIKETAVRFGQQLFKYNGYISRFGGDEFLAVVEGCDRNTVEELAKQLINSLADPFVVDNKKVNIGCSIGISFAPDDGLNAKKLIEKADSVMHQAKNAGRNTYVVFDPKMMDQVIFENKIKHKLLTHDLDDLLEPYFQPLINFGSMNIIGFEVLLRWFDDELGFIAPDVFIPIAERNGLAFKVDSWVFSKGVEQVDLWREKYNEDFVVAVNFSPINFHDNQLTEWIDNNPLFENYLDWVELEVTERLMLADDVVSIRGIERLLQTGIKFSIDDFGTGYSSLGYIKKFNHILSKIKIDRMFINEILNDDADQALVRSIVTMAESLSIEVLAEGVETKEQEEVLTNLGCEFGQGYLYSKPISAKEMDNIIFLWNKGSRTVDSFVKSKVSYRPH